MFGIPTILILAALVWEIHTERKKHAEMVARYEAEWAEMDGANDLLCD